MTNTSSFTITVRKGRFGGELCYRAIIAELPHVAEFADSFEKAYALAVDTIDVTAEFLQLKAMFAITSQSCNCH